MLFLIEKIFCLHNVEGKDGRIETQKKEVESDILITVHQSEVKFEFENRTA
jgi:hypothetical protein